MKRITPFSLILFIPFLLLLTACTFSVNNGLVKEHPREVESYTKAVFDSFYKGDVDKILAEATPNIKGFNKDNIRGVLETSHESVQPADAVIASRAFNQRNTQKYYTTLFYIPRDRGREVLRIIVSLKGDVCCTLAGLNLSFNLGDEFVMTDDTEEVKFETEAQEKITSDNKIDSNE